MTQIVTLEITAWAVIRSRPARAMSVLLMRHTSAICR
jgi:hypothetical protein